MNKVEALERIGRKGIITPEAAREICSLLETPFQELLIKHWDFRIGEENLFYYTYSFWPCKYGPGQGVDCTDLSYHIAEQMGLKDAQGYFPGSRFSGAGFQAEANAHAIAQKLSEQGLL